MEEIYLKLKVSLSFMIDFVPGEPLNPEEFKERVAALVDDRIHAAAGVSADDIDSIEAFMVDRC